VSSCRATNAKPQAKPGPKPRAGEVASSRIGLRVTADELYTLVNAAGRAGVSLSTFLRDAGVAAAGQPPPRDPGDEKLQMLASAIRDTVTRYAGEE